MGFTKTIHDSSGLMDEAPFNAFFSSKNVDSVLRAVKKD